MKLKYYMALSILMCISKSLSAQKCPKDFSLITFNNADTRITLYACIQQEASLDNQSVFWGVKNNTGSVLEISFIKVIYTTCGTVKRSKANIIIKPGAFMGGGNFTGDLDLSDHVFGEDCKGRKRINRVAIENIQITDRNLEEKRREEQRIKAEDERQKKIQEEKMKEEERINEEKRKAEEKRKEDDKEAERLRQAELEKAEQKRQEEKERLRQEEIKSIRTNNKEVYQQMDQAEDAQVAAMGSAVGLALMSDFLKNEIPQEKRPLLKAYLTLGMIDHPIISNKSFTNYLNNTTNYSSSPETMMTITGTIGGEFLPVYNRYLHIGAFGRYTYGVGAFMTGYSAVFTNATYGAMLRIGAPRIKLSLVADIQEVSGDFSSNSDASDYSSENYTLTENGNMQYSNTRYGGGIYISFASENNSNNEFNEKYIEYLAYYEQPEPNNLLKNNFITHELRVCFGSGYFLQAAYAGKYFTPGKNEHNWQDTGIPEEDKTYWQIHIGKRFNLMNAKRATYKKPLL